MSRQPKDAARWMAVAAILILPVVLVWSAFATYRQLSEQRSVYLQSRAAALAGRLETLSPTATEDEILESLSNEEASLSDFVVVRRGAAGDTPDLAVLWEGKELYRSERALGEGGWVRRFWVPFHSGEQLRVARLDLAESSADFLVTSAQRNLWFAAVGGVTLLGLLLTALVALRRNTQLESQKREMAHLARLGRMSAVLAHEIRNPLGAIKGFAQLAQERGGSQVSPMLDRVLQETARLERLVSDLLLYGRPPRPEKRRVVWTEVARDLMGHFPSEKSGRLQVVIEEDETALSTDRSILLQALLNLTRNATEAVQMAGGEVRVSTRHENGWFIISVNDDGPGFSAEARKRMFEPFFTTKASGTGLGLSITRNLVESLGGRLEMSSVPGAGVEAVIRLPIGGRQQ